MSICYFNNNYDKKFDCMYEVKTDGIEVVVNYDINDELPETNGVRTFTSNTKFNKRDILIIDHQTKMNYLLKQAYYSGHSEIYATPDCGIKTRFFSRTYFYDKDYEKLCNITNKNNISEIRVYSDVINDIIGHPSICKEKNDDMYIIKLKKKPEKKIVNINKNNIKHLTISDDWISEYSHKNNEINIKLSGYIEIDTKNNIDYTDVYSYLNELIIYFQLLKPNKFKIDKIMVKVDKQYRGLFIPIRELNYKNSYIDNSVKDSLEDFLFNCYNSIPYRNSKNEIRNIPYIILYTSRNLEDNFLMFYRFIECYYKKQSIENIKKTFIEYSIKNNYKENMKLNDEEFENLVYEIISLRNHYVHEGYYIKDKKLYISFPKVEDKPNPKNYIAKDVDAKWIYERTNILYKIVIDIIFNNMLNYKDYKFNKQF